MLTDYITRSLEDELALISAADKRAATYLAGVSQQRVFPDEMTIAQLDAFAHALPESGLSPDSTLDLLDRFGSPATAVSNGPNYFGYVIGATLPVAAAAERLALAWDQCASSFANSPAAATIEKVAGEWVLEALDLPRKSAVSFGTSATACGLACLAAARRSLLRRKGWDFDADGLIGAPEIKVVISAAAHVTIHKILRILGFGLARVKLAPVDEHGRIVPALLPPVDDMTILCLQAGEVNTGEFDPFAAIIPQARAAGAWIHVDGAFGLWARTSPEKRVLTDRIEQADSWTTDGHKWLNTPYDCAMAICRDADALAAAMNSDAAYATASKDAQKNLTLEFSRRARGIAIWAVLRTLGKQGVAELIERHCAQAQRLAQGLHLAGFTILNRVALNQVLVAGDSDAETIALQRAAQASGRIWFGTTTWKGGAAFRLSVSSWRTTNEDIDRAIDTLVELRSQTRDA